MSDPVDQNPPPRLPPHPDTLPLTTYTSRYGRFTLLAGEEFVGRAFQRGGHYNERRLQRLLPRLRPDDHIVEVGAHCGTDTVPYAQAVPQGAVLAIEPQRVLFDLLCRNLQQNAIAGRVLAVKAAAAHRPGLTTLAGTFNDGRQARQPLDYATGGNYGGITLGEGGELVVLLTLDTLDFAARASLLHLDAEGAERVILWGARTLLERRRPRLLVLEDNFGTAKEAAVHAALGVEPELAAWDAKSYLADLGYRPAGDDIWELASPAPSV